MVSEDTGYLLPGHSVSFWVVIPNFCVFPGHAVLSLPRRNEDNHYCCVNAGIYRELTFTASTS